MNLFDRVYGKQAGGEYVNIDGLLVPDAVEQPVVQPDRFQGMAPAQTSSFMDAYTVQPDDGILTKAMKKVGGVVAGLPKSAYDMGMEVLNDPGKVYNDVMAAERASRRRIPDQFKQMGAGVWQALNESPTYDPNATDAEGFNPTASFFNREGVSPSDLSNYGARQGMEWSKQATTDLTKDRMNDRRSTKIGQTVESTNESIIQQAPGLMLAFGGMPQFGLPVMGVQTFGQKYAENRAAGMPVEDATANAGIQAGVEVGTEILPFMKFAKFMKPGVFANESLRKQLAEVLVSEIPGEHLATALQNSSDAYFEEKDPAKRLAAVQKYIESNKFNEDQIDTFWTTLLQTGAMSAMGKAAHAVQNKISKDPLLKMTPEQEKEYEEYSGKVADAKEYQRLYAPQIAAGTAAPVQVPAAPAWLEAFNDLQRNPADAITGGRNFTPESAQAAALRASSPKQGMQTPVQETAPTSFQNESYDDTEDMPAPKGPLQTAAESVVPTTTADTADHIPAFTPSPTPVNPEPVPSQSGMAPSSQTAPVVVEPVREVTEADQVDFENAVKWALNMEKQGKAAISEVAGETERDRAWRLLSEYRKVIAPTVARDSAAPAVQYDNELSKGITNGATDSVSLLQGPANVDGVGVSVPEVQKTDDGSGSNLSQPGGLTDDVSQLRQETGKAQEVSPVRNEDAKPLDVAAHTAEHVSDIEKSLAEGHGNATLIPAVNNDAGVDSVASIANYEAALQTAGWEKRGKDWHKGEYSLWLRSQGNLSAPIVQYSVVPEGGPATADSAATAKKADNAAKFAQTRLTALQKKLNNAKTPAERKKAKAALDAHKATMAQGGDSTAVVPVDRRSDQETRKKVAEMTDAEKNAALLTNHLTGIPNKRAYEEAERLGHHAAIDADSLKWVNDNMGHESGNALLKGIAQAIAEETDRGYHISGDEFIVEGRDQAHVHETMSRVNARLKNAEITGTAPDGTIYRWKGLEATYGTGTTLAEADTALAQRKSEREAVGERAARGEKPAGVSAEPPAGIENNRSKTAAETEVSSPPTKIKTVRAAKPVAGLNPQRDHLLTAIAKLGGFDLGNAVSLWGNLAGDAAADKKINHKLFGRPLFRKTGGLTVDRMAELLAENGYLRRDENGKHDLVEFEDKLANAIAGKTVVSDQNHQEVKLELPEFSDEDLEELSLDSSVVEFIADEYADLFEELSEEDYNAIIAHREAINRKAVELIKEIENADSESTTDVRQDKQISEREAAAVPESSGLAVVERDSTAETPETGKRAGAASTVESQDKLFATPPTFGHKPQPKTTNSDVSTSGLLDNFTSTESVQPDLQSTAKTKTKPVADAGEELIYNKRNRLKGIKWDDIKDATGALKAESVQKSNVYAKPDYAALVEDGMPGIVAHIVKQVYDALPNAPVTRTTPTDADFQTYITAVNRVMDAVMSWSQDNAAIGAWAAKNAKTAGAGLGTVTSISDMMAKVVQPYDIAYPGGWRNFKDEVYILGGNKIMSRLQPGYNEVVRASKDLSKGWPGKTTSWQKQGYSLGSKDDVTIKPVSQPNRSERFTIRLKDRPVQSFDTNAEAQAYVDSLNPVLLVRKNYSIIDSFATDEEAAAAAKKLVTKEQKKGPDERGVNVAAAERIGPARRLEGENVSAQQIIDAFGYRGINIGNWVPADEAQMHLNFIYDSSYDLAELLDVPLPAISFNGTIGIAVGAQGGGKASAHYVPAYKEVNITRTTGAGAFIHELLGHGLDNYFGEMAGWSTDKKPYLSKHRDNAKEGTVRPEVVKAFRTIMETMSRRRETKQEAADRIKRSAEASEKSFEKYVSRFEAYFESIPEEGKAEAARLFERLRAHEFGDAYVAISSAKVVFPAVADLYQLAKKHKVTQKHGGKINIDEFGWLHQAAYGVKRSAEVQEQEHAPLSVNTDYAKASQAADNGKTANSLYWSTPWEMFARAVDAYITDKIAALNQKNTYLSGLEAVAPQGEERKAINTAFDALFGKLKTEETDKGVAIFEPGVLYGIPVTEKNMAKGEIYGTLDPNEVSYEITAIHNDGPAAGSDYTNTNSDRPAGVERNVDASGTIREQLGLFLPASAATKPLATDFNFAASFSEITKPPDPQFHGKVVRAISGVLYSPLTKIKTIKDAARVAQPIANRAQEGLIAIVVDKSGKILGVVQHSTGSANQSIVHPRDLSGVILDFPGANAVYLAHNHPTGDPTPSPEDHEVTARVARVLQAAGIEVKASIQIGFTGEYQAFPPLDKYNQEWGTNDTTEARKNKLSVYDRNIEAIADTPRITAPAQFMDVRNQYFPGKTGVLLIDGKNRPVGFIPMTPAEMLQLSTGTKESGAGRIMHRMHETGATHLMLSINDTYLDRRAVENVISFGNVLGARVLDAAAMDGVSMVETGVMPQGGDVFYQNPMLNPKAIVTSLSGLAKNLKEDIPKLVKLGQVVLREGVGKYQQFLAGMKQYLGEKWDAFKGVMLKVYHQAKKIVADERRMVGVDINAEESKIESATQRIDNIKAGYYVHERLPERYERTGQEGTLGAASSYARRIHEAVRRGEISGDSAWEKHQRYRELAESSIRPQETAALKQWAETNNLIIDTAEFDRQWQRDGKKGGAEHQVYLSSDGKRVFKRNKLNLAFHETYLDYFQRLAVHNVEFANAPYTLEGFVESDGVLMPVTSQPWVRGRKATLEESHGNMIRSGYEPVGTGPAPTSYRIPETGLVVRDVHGDNSRVDADGIIYVVDPVIEFDLDTKAQRLAKEAGIDSLPVPAQEKPEFGDEVDAAVDAWDKSSSFSIPRTTMQGDSGLGDVTVTPAKSLPFIKRSLEKEHAEQVLVKGGNVDALKHVARGFGKTIVFFRVRDAGVATDGSENGAVRIHDGGTGSEPGAGRSGESAALSGKGEISGFVNPAQPNVIFLNVDSSSHLLYIAGHELSHAIKMQDSALWAQMAKELQPLVRRWSDFKESLPGQYDKLSDDDKLQELFSDVMGNHFLNDLFWKDMAKENAGLFTRIARRAIQLINKALRRIVGYDVRTYVSDLEQSRAIIAKTLLQYGENVNKELYGKFAEQQDLEYLNSRLAGQSILEHLRSVGMTEDRLRAALGVGENKLAAAWHGSPHDHDGFSTAHIGTGEGAQAYGYGLYFAGNKDVAEYYRDNIRKESASELGRIIKEYSPDAWSKLDKATRTNEFYGTGDTAIGYLIQNINSAGTHSALGEDWKSVSDAIKSMPGAGRLYQVELAPKENEYLLWDDPISHAEGALLNAIPAIKEALGTSFVEEIEDHLNTDFEDITGQELYRSIVKYASESPLPGQEDTSGDLKRDASEYLHSLGIRGIKYLDGTSRAGNVIAMPGRSTMFGPVVAKQNYNYVIFNDADVSITNKYSIKRNFENVSGKSLLDNLKNIINPLDYSRFRDTAIDHLPPVATDWLADNLGNPFWKKENNPAAVPFYEEAKDREVTRMDNNIRMFGGLVDKEGKRVGWDKVKGLFDWTDKTTAWGKIRQEQYDALTKQQKAAYDVIRFEGDAYNKIYAQLGDALRNRRIKQSGLDEATFKFYQAALAEENKAFEVKIAIAAENMAEAGISPEDIEGHIAEFRSKYASIKGWVHRDHGEGDYQVRVYQTVDRLDFDSDVVQHQGKAADRLRLGTFPGAELSKKIEKLVEIKGGSFKQLRNGAIVILMPEGAGVQTLDAIDGIPLTDKNGDYKYKVLTYNRFVASSAKAKKLAAAVKADYAAAMPRNHRAGYIYETSWNRSDKVQEEDYQVLKTSDMKLELILRNAIDKAKAKDEVSSEDATAIKDELVRSTAEILLGRGAGLYQIRRAQYLIEGYDTDNAVKKYEDYVNGTAGLFSKARYALRQFHNMKSVPAATRAWATKYVGDSLRNMGTMDKWSGNMRAIVSLWYLGFNTSWMLVNSTQPYVLGQAELSRYTSGALGKIARAEKDVLTGKLSAVEKALLEDIQVRSQDHDSVMAEMTGSLEGVTGKASQTLHNVTQVAMAIGQKVEVLNRHTMIIAGYRVFSGQGMSHDAALKKSLDVNSAVNIDMGRYNLPGWARGPIGRMFYALQSYIQHMLNYLWNRSSSGNRADQKAILRLLFAMFLIGGLPAGAPGSDELDKLIQKMFGYSPKLALKGWSRKMAKDYDTVGEMLEGFVWHGVPGAFKPFGVGVSLTGATQLRMPIISNVIAGDDMAKSLGGPVWGLAQKGKMSIQAALRGDWGRSVEYMLPTAVANPLSAIRQATDGVKTASGKRVEYKGKQLKMEPHEAVIRAFGMQPVRTADISETRGFEKNTQAEWNDRRKDALDNYRMSRKLKFIQEFNIALKNSQAKGLVPLISSESLANVWGKTNQKKNSWERAHGAE
jgi:GGDEF domain-containing protein